MSRETERLAGFVSSLQYEHLPLPVVEQVKIIMMDTLSCAVAGYVKAREECGWAVAIAKELGGKPDSRVWFDGYRTSAAMAAMANATMVHTVDFDDTHINSVAHFGAGLLGTVLSLGEKEKSTGKEVITAFAAGFEVAARVGNSVNKGCHLHYRYWHPTATAGTIGCAAAAAKLIGMDAIKTEQVIGLGIDQAAGFRYCIDKGDFSKSLHPGWSAMRGIMAAEIIRAGANGPKGLLEYPTGFCAAMCAKPDLKELTAGLGTNYELMGDALKMYPTIHGSHSGIEATLNIVTGHNLDSKEIEHILVKLTPLAKGQGVNYQPESILAARLSLPFCIALAARRGSVTLDDFTEEILSDSEHLEFMKKIEVQPEPAFWEQYPESGFTSEVTVTMKDNTQFRSLVPYPRAHPKRPAEETDIREKYLNLTRAAWTKDKAETVYNSFKSLEQYSDIGMLISQL